MIAQLTGRVSQIFGQTLIVDVNGVGYEVFCSSEAVTKVSINQNTDLIIYTDVQENSIRLFGFSDFLEKQVFLLLVSVSGIGAKTAIEIISKISKLELLSIISREDSLALKKIKGVGGKTADRLILELKDKVKELILANRLITETAGSEPKQELEEALEALIALGFSRNQATATLNQIKNQLKDKHEAGEIVRLALAEIRA